MTKQNQTELGKTLWAIADQLRGAMTADDFRDYMLSFLFLRYLSDNYEAAAKKELGRDYPIPQRGKMLFSLCVYGRDRKKRLQPKYVALYQQRQARRNN